MRKTYYIFSAVILIVITGAVLTRGKFYQQVKQPVKENNASEKIYTSEEDYLVFKYPDFWQIDEEQNGININDKSGKLINIQILKSGYEDDCIGDPLNKNCEWITDYGLQKIINWRSPPVALVTIGIERYAQVRVLAPDRVSNQQFRQFLMTIESTIPKSISLWEPLCKAMNIVDFKILAAPGDGITHIARKSLTEYLNTYNLAGLSSGYQGLLPEEKIYIEDQIAKEMNIRVKSGENITISCELVEKAVISTRQLSIDQIKNLKRYKQGVNSFVVDDIVQKAIKQALDITTPPSDFKIIQLNVK